MRILRETLPRDQRGVGPSRRDVVQTLPVHLGKAILELVRDPT
jgi:hypothetical protein